MSLRPQQWIKNLLVFAALIFSGHLFDIAYIINTVLIFVAFCLVSGSTYIINDVRDKKEDEIHPEKKNRPIASGKISTKSAILFSIILLIVGLSLAFKINLNTFIALLSYFVLTSTYTLYFKHKVIYDIILVALGFVIRAIAGAVAIEVAISPWLLVCTFFLALFLVTGKRRHELVSLEESAQDHRKILGEYNLKLLDQIIVVVTAACIVSYALYTLDASTMAKFKTERLIYTIPIVLAGIFRYFFLIYSRNLGGSPEKVMLNDRGILLTVSLWIIMVGILIY